jgi:hypothetical protein
MSEYEALTATLNSGDTHRVINAEEAKKLVFDNKTDKTNAVTLIILSDSPSSIALMQREVNEQKIDGKEVMFVDINAYAEATGIYPKSTPVTIQVIEGAGKTSGGFKLLPTEGMYADKIDYLMESNRILETSLDTQKQPKDKGLQSLINGVELASNKIALNHSTTPAAVYTVKAEESDLQLR